MLGFMYCERLLYATSIWDGHLHEKCIGYKYQPYTTIAIPTSQTINKNAAFCLETDQHLLYFQRRQTFVKILIQCKFLYPYLYRSVLMKVFIPKRIYHYLGLFTCKNIFKGSIILVERENIFRFVKHMHRNFQKITILFQGISKEFKGYGSWIYLFVTK